MPAFQQSHEVTAEVGLPCFTDDREPVEYQHLEMIPFLAVTTAGLVAGGDGFEIDHAVPVVHGSHEL